jgi:hypothetical protein
MGEKSENRGESRAEARGSKLSRTRKAEMLWSVFVCFESVVQVLQYALRLSFFSREKLLSKSVTPTTTLTSVQVCDLLGFFNGATARPVPLSDGLSEC